MKGSVENSHPAFTRRRMTARSPRGLSLKCLSTSPGIGIKDLATRQEPSSPGSAGSSRTSTSASTQSGTKASDTV